MSTDRSQVELLLKMRAGGQQALDLFNGKLQNLGTEGQKAAVGLTSTEKKTRDSGFAATAARVAMGR